MKAALLASHPAPLATDGVPLWKTPDAAAPRIFTGDSSPSRSLLWNANRRTSLPMKTLARNADELVGTYRTFGGEGPVYRVLRKLDGDRVRVQVVESGEELDYAVQKALKALGKLLSGGADAAALKQGCEELTKVTATIADDVISSAVTKALREEERS
jgi:hypothetical protein